MAKVFHNPHLRPGWRSAVGDFLNAKVNNAGQCRECCSEDVALGEDVVSVATTGGRTYLAVLLICQNCGHTRHFNAVVAKLIDGAGPRSKEATGVYSKPETTSEMLMRLVSEKFDRGMSAKELEALMRELRA